jgi:hypothetical protein
MLTHMLPADSLATAAAGSGWPLSHLAQLVLDSWLSVAAMPVGGGTHCGGLTATVPIVDHCYGMPILYI